MQTKASIKDFLLVLHRNPLYIFFIVVMGAYGWLYIYRLLKVIM